MAKRITYILWFGVLLLSLALVPSSRIHASDDDDHVVVEDSKVNRGTDDQAIQREEEAIKIDGLSVKEVRQLREKAEKHQFQDEVNQMMKLIINSLYINKEIFLRELISKASKSLDKIRLLSLTDQNVLNDSEELSIRVKADKENHVLHIIDTGIGMTKTDLINILPDQSDCLNLLLDRLRPATSSEQQQDLIRACGVGFYTPFLVADRVVVTTKGLGDDQYIWESDSASFTIAKDPRGNTLKRGSQISLYLKEEAYDFLQPGTLKKLVIKHRQSVNFEIFLWQSKTETVEEAVEETEEAQPEEDGAVEGKEEKPKTKSVEKTVWDWEKVNKARIVTNDHIYEALIQMKTAVENPMAMVVSALVGSIVGTFFGALALCLMDSQARRLQREQR